MKQVFKTVFPIVLLYIILGFAVVMAVSLPERTETGVLPPFTASFRFMQAFIRYTGLFPALAAAGLLTGYATAFRKLVPESVGRWSPKLFSVLKNAFLLCVLCIGLYVLLSEGAAPVLKNRSGDLLSKSGSYQDYLALAQAETENGNYRAALSNAEAALGIWEESPEASRAAEQARLLLAGTGDGIPEEEEPAQENPEAPGEAGYHAFELLELAREAEARTDFYNAHYYATLAWRMFDAGDPNKEAAMRLASGAWNRITGALDGIRAEPQRAHYAKKMRGYAAIQAGDFLTAYYLFLEMQDGQRQAAQGTDPDIARFLAVARQGLLRSFFSFLNRPPMCFLPCETAAAERTLFFCAAFPGGAAKTERTAPICGILSWRASRRRADWNSTLQFRTPKCFLLPEQTRTKNPARNCF